MEDKDLFILGSQCCGCWCPGDARSQGINSYGIELILEYTDFSTRGLRVTHEGILSVNWWLITSFISRGHLFHGTNFYLSFKFNENINLSILYLMLLSQVIGRDRITCLSRPMQGIDATQGPVINSCMTWCPFGLISILGWKIIVRCASEAFIRSTRMIDPFHK